MSQTASPGPPTSGISTPNVCIGPDGPLWGADGVGICAPDADPPVGMMEAEGMAELRTELLTVLSGAVVEVGAGNGMNFAHYPNTVTAVTGVEAETYLRCLATKAARTALYR